MRNGCLWVLFVHQLLHKHSNEVKGTTVQILEGKGKVISLQAWTVPEGPRRLRLSYFKTIGTRSCQP